MKKIRNTFIPKGIELTDHVCQELIKKFNLSDFQLEQVRYWNHHLSPHKGTIIVHLDGGKFVCQACTYSVGEFKASYSDGEVWGDISPSQPVPRLDWSKECASTNLCGYCTGSPPGSSCDSSCFTRSDWMLSQVPKNKLKHLHAELAGIPTKRTALDLREAQLRAELEEMQKEKLT